MTKISDRKRKFIYVTGIVAGVIFLLTLAIYIPALKNNFVWDDVHYISKNALIRSLSIHSFAGMLTGFHAANWHPLTWLSLAIDYSFWGLDPFGYHLTNTILHGLNTLLVFFLTLWLTKKAYKTNRISSIFITTLPVSTRALIVAGVTALLFGLHPLQVESVAWISQRKNLLCNFFVLLSILTYLSYISTDAKKYQQIYFTVCLLLFVFALMSKPMAITLPVILLLLDIYPLKRISLYSGKTRKTLSVFLEKIPFFALSTAAGIITILAQQSGEAVRSLEQFPVADRLLNATRALVFYLEKIILPVNLVPYYPFPNRIHLSDMQYVLSAVVILAITGICLWMVKHGNNLFFTAWSYYVVTLLPVLGIIQVGGQAAADRYTYLPSLSIFLLTGTGFSWLFEKFAVLIRRSISGVTVLVPIGIFILLGQSTVKQIRIWNNSEILWSYVVSVFPFPRSDPIAHYNLGNVYVKKNESDIAIAEYKRAIALNPQYDKAHCNLGIVYLKKNELDKAITEFMQALTTNPRYVKAHNNLGTTYLKNGEVDKAIFEFKRAIVIEPNNANAHNNIGLAYQKKGMLKKAITEYRKALIIKPYFSHAHYNLSVAYYYNGDYQSSIRHCDRAVALGAPVIPELLEMLKPYR